MVKVHHLQLRCHPLLFRNFKWFNIKVAAIHNPFMQKEMDELLAQGAIEVSTGGARFYSIIFMVHKHTDGLQPVLNLK